VKIGVLTVSDRGALGAYEDQSGPLIIDILTRQTSWQVDFYTIVSDDRDLIADTLRGWHEQGVNLILTTGGTGFALRDVTPEATRMIIEREAPGIAEALRAESLKVTRHAMLSRGIAGMVGETLIINLPGSPKAVKENLDILLPVLPHALSLLTGQSGTETQHRSV
jgi:molybdopterin adenylyltransferase